MAEKFELRHLAYFRNHNSFYGSSDTLRYRVSPKGEVLEVSAWKNDRCFECQESPEQLEVPLSDEGLAQVVEWLEGRG